MKLLLATLIALTLPKYWSVHIDTPRRDARAAFEQVDVDTAAAIRDFYAARGEERPPSWIFSTADGVYYSLRGRTSLTDFDNHPAPKELSAKTAPISDRAHVTLATHNNEIWQTDADFTRLADPAAMKYARLRVDHVAPPDEAKYEAKAAEAARAESLAKQAKAAADVRSALSHIRSAEAERGRAEALRQPSSSGRLC